MHVLLAVISADAAGCVSLPHSSGPYVPNTQTHRHIHTPTEWARISSLPVPDLSIIFESKHPPPFLIHKHFICLSEYGLNLIWKSIP